MRNHPLVAEAIVRWASDLTIAFPESGTPPATLTGASSSTVGVLAAAAGFGSALAVVTASRVRLSGKRSSARSRERRALALVADGATRRCTPLARSGAQPVVAGRLLADRKRG